MHADGRSGPGHWRRELRERQLRRTRRGGEGAPATLGRLLPRPPLPQRGIGGPPARRPTRWVTRASGSRATPVSMRSSTPLVQNMREEAGPPRDSSRMLYPTLSPVGSPRSAATRSATALRWVGVGWGGGPAGREGVWEAAHGGQGKRRGRAGGVHEARRSRIYTGDWPGLCTGWRATCTGTGAPNTAHPTRRRCGVAGCR